MTSTPRHGPVNTALTGGPTRHYGPVTDGGPAEWMAQHENVHIRPVEERDLRFLERVSTDPALSEPFEWHGYRDPNVHRRRWEQDRL